MEVFLSGSDPDARDKEKPQWARLVRAMMREKCTEEGEERNGGAARSANLGGCKGRAANGGEGKSGRWYRPEKEERRDEG